MSAFHPNLPSGIDPLRRLKRVGISKAMKHVGLGLLLFVDAATAAAPPSKLVEGPMLLCFKYSTFQLAHHERVTDFSGSAESMSVEIEGRNGTYKIGESEIWAEPKNRGQIVSEHDRTTVYKAPGKRRYSVYGPTDYSPNQPRLLIWLSGEALHGNSKDKSIYERFDVRDPKGASCGHGFTYSWDFLSR